jgi:peptidoglycan/LPS O-acetylase OafA/YrhL
MKLAVGKGGVTHSESYIPTLDGWRAVAVTIVILNHCQLLFLESSTSFMRALAPVVVHGGIGVDVFFALSGYLITTLLLMEQSATGRIRLGAFYRLFRIVPAMFVYLSTLAILKAVNVLPGISVAELASAQLFVRNYFQEGSWYTGHFWSLAVEEHYYFVIPWILSLLTREGAVRTLATLGVACIATRFVQLTYFPGLSVNPEFRTENRVDALMWGSLVAVLMEDRRRREMLLGVLKPAVLVPLVAVMAAIVVVSEEQWLRRTLVAIALPLMILYTVTQPDGTLGRILEHPWLRWVGRLSYSLYIWQQLFFVLLPVEQRLVIHTFPINVIGTLCCAVASYYLVERTFLRFRHTLEKRWLASKAQQVTLG